MLRVLISSTLSILLLLTLQWGGCISCPQFYMFPAKSAAKNCCHKGQCDRTAQKDNTTPAKECKRMPLETQSSASAQIELAGATLTSTGVFMSPIGQSSLPAPPAEAPALEHSPPDLTILNATLLI